MILLFISLVWDCTGLISSQIKCKNFIDKDPKPWNTEQKQFMTCESEKKKKESYACHNIQSTL